MTEHPIKNKDALEQPAKTGGFAGTHPNFIKKRPRSRYRPVVITLLSGLVLSVFAFTMALRWETHGIGLEFQQAAEDRMSALSRAMASNLMVIESIGAFFAASQRVERLEFREFVRPLLSHHPGIQALEWIPRIPASQRDAYEKAVRAEGFPRFQITERKAQGHMIPATQREAYFPVYFVEPYKGNEAALGFDLASNPTRRSALEQARDTGKMMATSRIKLVQESDEMFGILIFSPVYKRDTPIHSVNSRRKHLEGFVLGVFSIHDIGEAALAYLAPAGIDIQMLDLSALSKKQSLYFHPSRIRRNPVRKPDIEDIAQKTDFRHTQTLDVAGRKWLILCTPTPDFISARKTWQPWGLFSLFVACTAIAAIYFFTNIRRTAQLAKAYHDLRSETKERMQATEALRESEERFREMAETIHEVFWLLDWKEQKVIYVSPAYEEVWGRSRETLYDHYEEWAASIHPDDVAYAEKSLARIVEKGGREEREYRIIRPDGTVRWISDRGFAILGKEGEVLRVTGIAEDITDRKFAAEALRESEERYRILAQESPVSIMAFDRDGKVTFVNSWHIKTFARSKHGADFFLGKKITELPAIVGAGVARDIGKVLKGENVVLEDVHSPRFSGGHSGYQNIKAVPIYREGEFAGGILIREDVTKRKNAENRLARHRDQLEEVVGERTRELEAAQEKLLKRERLSILGQLTATVSHELRNPLGVIRSSAFFLKKKIKEKNPKTQKHLDRIEEQVELCNAIVEDLLEYTRGRISEPVEGDINVWLKRVLGESFDSEQGHFRLGLSEAQLRAPFDPNKMRRAVINLVDNALKAVDERERKRRNREAYEREIIITTKEDAANVIIEIKDNGIGMDTGTAFKAFEPLFTTRARGTGLGLANVKKIVEEHGGAVTLQSAFMEGTRVTLTLPKKPQTYQNDRKRSTVR